MKIKSIFPKNEVEKKLVVFIGRYQYISVKDVKYFFNDTYYPKRIARLIKNNMLRRYKKYLVLADNGYNYLELMGENPSHLRYQKKYVDRLKYMSHLAALYYKDNFIIFSPSFEIKDKTVFTESSRKFIGILSIFGTRYLTYHISEEHTEQYINSVIYDLQKETKFKNILILINNIERVKMKNFAFGFNSVIFCEDNDEKLQELKYIHQINWIKIIRTLYNEKVHLSEYNFCDYTDNKEKFINTFYLMDSEKINRIDMFLKNNPLKQADIICNANIRQYIRAGITNY